MEIVLFTLICIMAGLGIVQLFRQLVNFIKRTPITLRIEPSWTLADPFVDMITAPHSVRKRDWGYGEDELSNDGNHHNGGGWGDFDGQSSDDFGDFDDGDDD